MSDDLQQRVYPEDERLRAVQEDPDRRMTRDEWEREESLARQAAHKRHVSVQHDREVQQEHDRKHRAQHRSWGKILLWIGIGIVVMLLIFLIGYLPHRAEAKKAAAAAREREQDEPQVPVLEVKRSSKPGQLTVPGTTAPMTEAYIYARANGYLKKRFVDIGDHVKKGQLLGVIDAPDLDQNVEMARQQLHQAEADEAQQQAQLDLKRVTWERWRTLVAKGVFSRQDGDQRETDYRAQLALVASAQRNVESFRANLNRAIALQSYERVTAPFDGVVTQRNTDIGALVGAGGSSTPPPMNSSNSGNGGSAGASSSNTSGASGNGSSTATPSTGQSSGGALFAVAQVDKLRILVAVPEGYATSIVAGMQAQVFLQERTGKPIYGTVTRSTHSIDANTRTMLAEVDLDNHDGRLNPGMYTVVTFVQVRGTPPLTVPGDAIVVRQDRTMVAIVRDMKVQMVPVEIGRDYGPSVEILTGLHEGDHVITTVTDGVRQGAKVRPLQQSGENGEDASGKGGQQTNQVPNAGPNEYGDQSIVNQKSESTNDQGKKGGGTGGGQQGSGGKQSQDKSSK
ncbi:RND family efflux transporter, MFP subunit [Terriglobus roseus DSM 18391]|uniref:RND family efflux transporter, MFP subunit n=1 Tax=Terriglobus roseus (strain DSM 18391 / NRRL B-41598 / KBS 63) TaxID=926566 RepID=I3ZFH1_TERRK|nr:efflux RND transporter periplasmic adaptor subunit [Terriglobus roseus]AFL87989.1 RND family efflux transporter, MFP subunit [Terriglobus roseus DSM 18391]